MFRGGGGGRVLVRGASELRRTSLLLGVEGTGAEVVGVGLSTVGWQQWWAAARGVAEPANGREGTEVREVRYPPAVLGEEGTRRLAHRQ
jgi:hypothetical protein